MLTQRHLQIGFPLATAPHVGQVIDWTFRALCAPATVPFRVTKVSRPYTAWNVRVVTVFLAEVTPDYVSKHLDHARRNRRHDSLDAGQDMRVTAELAAVQDDGGAL